MARWVCGVPRWLVCWKMLNDRDARSSNLEPTACYSLYHLCCIREVGGGSLSSGHGFLQAEGHDSCILESLFPTTVWDTQELNQ